MEQAATDPPAIEYTLSSVRMKQRSNDDNNQVMKEVNCFLQQQLSGNPDEFLKEAEYKMVGSSVENLITTKSDDYDLLFLLGQPYTPHFFESTYEADGRHFLTWNGKRWKGGKPRYVDSNNHLCPIPLRSQIHSCLQSAMEDAIIAQYKVTRVFVWKQTVRALLKDLNKKEKHRFVVDIIPQIIGAPWSQVDGVESFNKLGPQLQSAVRSLESAGESAVHFSLFASPGSSPLLFSSSFSLLELEFFGKHEKVRDIVLLGKLMLSGHRWKDKFGLKSAHLKRVVMANTAALDNLTPWSGMQEMWSIVIRQLKEGHLDSFPDKNADLMFDKTEEECEFLAQTIMNVIKTLNPAFFPNYL